MLGGVALVVLLVIGGSYGIISRMARPFRTVAALDTSAYVENANGLRGNTYRMDGTVHSMLAWSDSRGRLISVQADEPIGKMVPVMVSPKFADTNLQRGQRFTFKVEVAEGGLLVAQDLVKR
jgi:hypothetical protein